MSQIPDSAILFLRVHRVNIKNNGKSLRQGAYKERGEGKELGLSVNWNQYATASETLDQLQALTAFDGRPRDEADYGVVSFAAGSVFNAKPEPPLQSFRVEHSPISDPPNPAHSNILRIPREFQQDSDDVKVADALDYLKTWEIYPQNRPPGYKGDWPPPNP